MKSVTIVGGGLAGLSLGVSLRKRDVPVELYEKDTYPRHKVCGEFICGVTEKTVESLGIKKQLSDALTHREIRWWMGEDELLSETLPSPAMGISRYLLDKRLADQFVRMGGMLNTKSRKKIEDISKDGRVNAAGKSPQKKVDSSPEWIGLKIHATKAEISGLEMHSSSNGKKGGYVGLCQVEDQRVNCCGLFHLQSDIKPRDADGKWNSPAALIMEYAERCGMCALLDRMKNWSFDQDSASATAGFQLGMQPQSGRFCIGDASSLIPPFTGNGMSMALESSAIATDWLVRYADASMSWAEAADGYRDQAKKHFSRRLNLSQTLHPMLFNPVGRTALKVAAKLHILPFKTMFQTLRTP